MTNIDEYFSYKQIGYYDTSEQVVDGVKFYIHYQKEEKYVRKIMSCHGVLTWVEDDDTFCTAKNPDKTQSMIQFKYPEPISHHN